MEQKKRMAPVIFKDEQVLYPLRQARNDRKAGVTTYSDSEEQFAQLIAEVEHGKNAFYSGSCSP